MNNADHKYLADLFEGNPVGHKWVYEAIEREVEKRRAEDDRRMRLRHITEKDQLLSAAIGFAAILFFVGAGFMLGGIL